MAAPLFSRPTPSGTTSFGKTTASRSGTSGRSLGNWFACALVLAVVVSESVTFIFLLAFGLLLFRAQRPFGVGVFVICDWWARVSPRRLAELRPRPHVRA